MALFKDEKNKTKGSPDKAQESSELADSTYPKGDQTVDRKESKAVPDSTPDEIAPVPDAAGNEPKEPAASESGYRVAAGKSITSTKSDLLDAGSEITEKDVPGGAERLEELAKGGFVVKTAKGSGAPKEDAQTPHGVDGNAPEEPPSENPPKADPKLDPKTGLPESSASGLPGSGTSK